MDPMWSTEKITQFNRFELVDGNVFSLDAIAAVIPYRTIPPTINPQSKVCLHNGMEVVIDMTPEEFFDQVIHKQDSEE